MTIRYEATMVNSRRKGADGERELARVLSDYGYEARRGQQFSGANGDADVIGLPGIHIECKRVERLNLYDAIAQAKHDAREGESPAVFHRRDNCKWLVTMEIGDWIDMYNDTCFPERERDKQEAIAKEAKKIARAKKKEKK